VQADARLTRQLRLVHAESRRSSGRPRLARAGRRRYRVTTDSGPAYPITRNHLARRCTPRRLNRVWAADLTFCATRAGWCDLAVILDLTSRRGIGWAVRRSLASDVDTRAWRMALARRRPTGRLVHHSDRSCQSAGQASRGLLARAGIRARMSRRGNCWDHAPVESFFSTLKAELVPDRPWADPATAAAAIGEYLEAFDNRRRLQSSFGYLTPVAYDTKLERPT
jgi:putative transposase